MSRLTGADAYGLMEAYNNVYAPQELTEEQVWEEVETWVNSLLEEGYDLSDYTWEEMYESYLKEMGQRMTTGQATAPKAPPIVQSKPQVAGGGMGGRRGGGSSPGSVRPATTPAPAAKPTAPAPAAARPAAPTARPAAPTARPAAPTARPSGGAPRPATTAPASAKVAPKPAAPAGGSALDRATAAASKPAAFSPKPQSDVGKMIDASKARQAAQTPKPAASAPARPMGGARGRLMSSFDPFDVIKGHLIDEGYADTEESALAIMTNMSEEWRQSILDEGDNYDKNRQRAAKRAAERNAARDRGQTGNVPGVGYVTPRRERETYRDSAGTERHTSGARMPKKEG
jgi:hypothetical protein